MPNPEIRTIRISTSRSTRDLFREVKEKMEKEYEGITDGQVLQLLLVSYELNEQTIGKVSSKKGRARKIQL